MEISSSRGLKNAQKLALGKKILPPFALVLIFEDFSTLEMKKFPYLKTGPFGNPIFTVLLFLLYIMFSRTRPVLFLSAVLMIRT